jgi:multicomponent Na+:H+ antiporter subunit E
MNLPTINILLALAWCAVTADFSMSGLATGVVVGYGALWLTQPLYGPTGYFRRTRKIAALVLYFLYDLVASSIRVVREVLTPGFRSRPGIIAVPLDAASDAEITVLANLISLTPGTLSLDVSEDRRTLYVHAMFIDDPDKVRRELKSGMERRVLGVSR